MKLNYLRQKFTFSLVANILAILLMQGNANARELHTKEEPNSFYYQQFQDIFERIQADYVSNPELQEMTDEAINAMLQSLDPYSSYYTDDDLKFFLDHTEGEFGGIGVEIIPDQGLVKVISPIDELPAYEAGIKAGDLIIGVNGQLVSNLGFNKAVRQIRGKPGSKLNLLVISEDETQPREVELKRDIVKIKPIKYEHENDEVGAIGYVRIVTFNKNTAPDFKKAIKDLQEKTVKEKGQLKGLIIDVRNNPGGILEQAVGVAEYLIDSGTVVKVRSKTQKQDQVISAGRFTAKAPDVPIVLLINSGSASASEILAGALQDHKRAIIVGTTSFGKGVVQMFRQINERAAIKLTTSKYYTPNDRSINGTGIEPDIFIEPQKVEFSEEDKPKKAFNESSIKQYLQKFNTDEKETTKNSKDKAKKEEKKSEHKFSAKYKKDYQYARAYDLIRGLIIMKEYQKK